jgi:hypothetical protein
MGISQRAPWKAPKSGGKLPKPKNCLACGERYMTPSSGSTYCQACSPKFRKAFRLRA